MKIIKFSVKNLKPSPLSMISMYPLQYFKLSLPVPHSAHTVPQLGWDIKAKKVAAVSILGNHSEPFSCALHWSLGDASSQQILNPKIFLSTSDAPLIFPYFVSYVLNFGPWLLGQLPVMCFVFSGYGISLSPTGDSNNKIYLTE